jgi:thymidylate kinase
MWIEVIGLPGVGKTTLIEKNFVLVNKNYTVVTSRTPTKIHSFLRRFYYHFHCGRVLNGKKLAKKLAYRLSFRFLKSRSQNIFFFDSGLLQIVLEDLIKTNFEDQEAKVTFLKSFLPDKLIYVEDNVHAILGRVTDRLPKHFEIEDKELEKRYIKAQKIVEEELLPMIPIVYKIKPYATEKFIEALAHEKIY